MAVTLPKDKKPKKTLHFRKFGAFFFVYTKIFIIFVPVLYTKQHQQITNIHLIITQ